MVLYQGFPIAAGKNDALIHSIIILILSKIVSAVTAWEEIEIEKER